MNRYEFKLPDIGEGVAEGEIVQWLIKPGDQVREDQPIVEVMTDKATVTITSPKAGAILETRGAVGSIVPVHNVLVVFDVGGTGAGASGAPVAQPAPAAGPKHAPGADGPAATAVGDIRESLPGMNLTPQAPTAAKRSPSSTGAYFNDKPLATPATRKFARDRGVDLRTVPPSGPGGRVTQNDVQAVGAGSSVSPAPQGIRQLAPQLPLQQNADDERVPLRGMRKRIFEQMARSKHTAAHFTFVEECDAGALIALRKRLAPAAEAQGVKLTYLPFFVKASVFALRKHRIVNSAFDDAANEIVIRGRHDVGIATATEAGLTVPVVRNAGARSMLDIAREIARMGEAAKAGKLRQEDLGNSSFTITSLGAQGGLLATPVLNYPEVAIMGVHQIKQKPVVRNGQIVVGDVMLLSFSFDHRIVDGHIGAAFAYDVIGYLENPDRFLLEMA